MAKIIPRSEVRPLAWNNFVEAHPDGWWFHTDQWLEYALAYTPGSFDLSSAWVGADGSIESVFPLVVSPTGDYVNGGQMVAYPLGAHLPVPLCSLGVAGRPGQSLDATASFNTYVVDLGLDLAEMWKRLRGSYKPLINKANRERSIQTFIGSGEPEDGERSAVLMQTAQELHAAAAGRRTRSDETWRLQAEWLAHGTAALSIAYAATRPVGFAYALNWKGWSYYASGASLEDSVQHALIWNLMIAIRAEGGKHFEVGHSADANADAKERNIAFFKSGFGGSEWPVAAVIK